MSDYAQERAESTYAEDKLAAANRQLYKAFSDQQAELVNRLTALLAHYEMSVFRRIDGLETQIINLTQARKNADEDKERRLNELTQQLINLRGVVELTQTQIARIAEK